MKKNKFFSKILIAIGVMVILLFFNMTEVAASLQANPNTNYVKKAPALNWISAFRTMEETGEAMGLNETLNSDLTPSSESNNIDVHMMKVTEYGAMIILSASGYGNPSNEKIVTSTTGNETGVIVHTGQMGEWSAGALKTPPAGIEERYFTYYSEQVSKPGDAFDCAGWHGAGYKEWYSNRFCVRMYAGIFSFNYNSSVNNRYCSRGVAVCGEGL